MVAALLAEVQDVRGSACFDNSETEFRCEMCPPGKRGGPGALKACGQIRVVESTGTWKARGWGPPLGGEKDNEYVVRGMMWADNCWLFCDSKERLVCRVNDIIEELLDLDTEPTPESVWWTCTYKDEDAATF